MWCPRASRPLCIVPPRLPIPRCGIRTLRSWGVTSGPRPRRYGARMTISAPTRSAPQRRRAAPPPRRTTRVPPPHRTAALVAPLRCCRRTAVPPSDNRPPTRTRACHAPRRVGVASISAAHAAFRREECPWAVPHALPLQRRPLRSRRARAAPAARPPRARRCGPVRRRPLTALTLPAGRAHAVRGAPRAATPRRPPAFGTRRPSGRAGLRDASIRRSMTPPTAAHHPAVTHRVALRRTPRSRRSMTL
jgi:hypothetical protein